MATPGRSSLTLQAGFLLLLTCALAVVGQFSLRARISWKGDWTHYVESKAQETGIALADDELAQRIVEQQSHIIIDARSTADYDTGHIPGAFSVPHAKIDLYLPQVLPLLTPGQPIMTYCSGLECDESLLLSRYLIEQGFTNITLFAGGFTAWKAAHFPLEGGR